MSNPENNWLRFQKSLRLGKYELAWEILIKAEAEEASEAWTLARLDLERLEAASCDIPRRWASLTPIRPLEVGFAGHWIMLFTGFLPLVTGVLALEYPPLWFGVVLSLIGLLGVWFGKRVLEGRIWILKMLAPYCVAYASLSILGIFLILFGGESFWTEVGTQRGILLPYMLLIQFAAHVLILSFVRRNTFRSFFGEARRKADYAFKAESNMNTVKYLGIALMILSLGAVINLFSLDSFLKPGSAIDLFALPIPLPGVDYLVRLGLTISSILIPIQSIGGLVGQMRIATIVSFAFLALVGYGLWKRSWWSWGAGLAVAVVLFASVGDVFRLLGNPLAGSLTFVNLFINLVLAIMLYTNLTSPGTKLSLGADADAELALFIQKKASESNKKVR